MPNLNIKTALALAAATSTLPCGAAIIQTSVFTEGTIFAYDANASNSDLINQGAPSLASFTTSEPGTWPASGTNDGTASAGGVTGDYAYWDGEGEVIITLTYELTGSATGYDITSINSIYGWSQGRRHAAQYYSVFIATIADPTYNLLHTVAYDPSTSTEEVASQVTLTDSTGVLASGVTGIRFVAIEDTGPGSIFDEVGVIHEIDVFGTATVPEPGSLALLAAGSLMIARRRRG